MRDHFFLEAAAGFFEAALASVGTTFFKVGGATTFLPATLAALLGRSADLATTFFALTGAAAPFLGAAACFFSTTDFDLPLDDAATAGVAILRLLTFSYLG